jgi:hypothetical protein
LSEHVSRLITTLVDETAKPFSLLNTEAEPASTFDLSAT